MRRDIAGDYEAYAANGVIGSAINGNTNGVKKAPPNGHTNGVNGAETNDSTTPVEELDILVIGAGFAGVYLLHKLRQKNFQIKVVEAGSDLGGVWHWNRYPGARVDSQYPVYSYSLPEVYEDWEWSCHYPDWKEIQEYFHHVDRKLEIKKDTVFNTKVISAKFDEESNRWTVCCNTGRTFRVQYLIASTGFAAKRYIPDYEGIDSFKGVMHHSSFWPTENVDVEGKRVGVLGSGSTGIQIAQEWAKQIGNKGNLELFQRTPNLCCPMKQKFMTSKEQTKHKAHYPEWFDTRWKTYGGFLYQYRDIKTFDQTPEERRALFEELWEMGGFRFLMNNYMDMTRDLQANREAYNFWRDKTRRRIKDKTKADLLAPMEAPHPFGAKRLALEQTFYEEVNRENFHIVDIKNNPIIRFEPEGVRTADGTLHKLDVLAIATGFDSVTGGLKNISISGLNGELLTDKWAKGTWTYLGMATARFPNFFFTYGPQAPTAFSNGVACCELQADWLVDLLCDMRDQGHQRINAKPNAEENWKVVVNELSALGLRHYTDSWYNGANIPGKPREALNYAGGLPKYKQTLKEEIEGGYSGFEIQ
ncbi:hypothetical protein VE02_08161 [Pseudogymnoascus sp. 03VT05]|nr:hypothetical protein VE02_08161 [Pseudogymnoascus sp. 03VT05]